MVGTGLVPLHAPFSSSRSPISPFFPYPFLTSPVRRQTHDDITSTKKKRDMADVMLFNAIHHSREMNKKGEPRLRVEVADLRLTFLIFCIKVRRVRASLPPSVDFR